jgi:Leucine-rich repeat (LRR) protein
VIWRTVSILLLRNLSMQFCYLEQVPSTLSALTALTFLDLSANRFLGGWQYLAHLAHLQCLNLASCLTTHIPSMLRKLMALTSLRVSSSGGNAIVGGWEHLQPLTLLQDCRLPDYWRP